jgi:BirA family biotin operon repressor/biotin-[acetyl-CoA-carboxylase] ligase
VRLSRSGPDPGADPAYSDLDRPPLQARALRAALSRSPFWRDIQVLPSVASTNDVVTAAARAGEPEGLVVVAEVQTGGRGRLDRSWVSPPRAGLTFSVLLRPDVSVAQRAVVPLLAGVAVARALRAHVDVDAWLKWPNDVLVNGRKVAGLLAEVAGDGVAVGIGLNVSTRRDELPRDDASSLALERGDVVDRGPVLLAVLRSLADGYLEWVGSGGTPDRVLAAYRDLCATIGSKVSVALPSGGSLDGVADDVDDAGNLVVRAGEQRHVVSAGDVVHVRSV